MAVRRLQVDITAKDKSKQAFNSLQNSARKTQRAFAAVGTGLKGALLPLAGAAGGIALIRQTAAAMNELDLIAKRARTAGLGTDFYQGLTFAAEEANVNQSLLNSSMLAFVKRVGEAKAGVGPLVTGLKNADAGLLNLLRNSRSQREAFLILSDAISGATSATDKARIANAAFGRSGIEMVRILNQSGDGLLETTKRAQKLGLVYDKELLAKQEKLNNQLGIFNKVISVQFKSILVQLAPLLTAVAAKTAEWVREFAKLFNLSGGSGLSNIQRLTTRINEINKSLNSGEFDNLPAARNRMLAELEAKTKELDAARVAYSGVVRANKALVAPTVSVSAGSILPIGGKTKTTAKKGDSDALKNTRKQMTELREQLALIEQQQRRAQEGAQAWGNVLGGVLDQLTNGADDATKSMVALIAQVTQLIQVSSQASGGSGGGDLVTNLLSGAAGGGFNVR